MCVLKGQVASALRSLKDAELQRGRLLRSLRGDLEALAADLRLQAKPKVAVVPPRHDERENSCRFRLGIHCFSTDFH